MSEEIYIAVAMIALAAHIIMLWLICIWQYIRIQVAEKTNREDSQEIFDLRTEIYKLKGEL